MHMSPVMTRLAAGPEARAYRSDSAYGGEQKIQLCSYY